jgi:hypothetical protein
MSRSSWRAKKKKVAPGQGKATFSNTKQPEYKVISSRSTSTEDQRARLLELLKISPQTTYSLRAHGIAQCAARIFELRKDGYPITTSTVTAVDSDGYSHINVALYSLEAA